MQDESSDDALQQETRPVEYALSTWNALTTLATEQQHALRHAFDSKTQFERSGEVCQQKETVTAVSDSRSAQRHFPQDPRQPDITSSTFDEAVQAEVQRATATRSTRNPETDVVVRLEFMRGTDSRATVLAIVAATVIGATVLLAEFIKKLQLGWSPYYYSHTAIYAWNTAVASLCLVALTPCLGIFLWRLFETFKHNKNWIARVKVSASLIAVEGIIQWINLVFYMAPNVYLLHKPCYLLAPFVYASGFAQWSCWNTIFMLFLAHAYACQQTSRKPQNRGPLPTSEASQYGDVVVDGGFYLLWPCLVPWVLFQADMGYAWLHHLSGGLADSIQSCEAGAQSMTCAVDKGTRLGIDVGEGLAGIYFVITCALLLRKLSYLKKLPYSGVKRGLVYFTIQLWLRLGVMAYFLLCMTLLWLVRFGSCAANKFVVTGVMPMHVVMTVNAVVFCYVCTPVNPPERASARKVWLQEVAWTEADKCIKLAARSAMVANDPDLERQPMFCYQTMLNLLYWSCLVYDHERGRLSAKGSQVQPVLEADNAPPQVTGARTVLTLATAMSLYGLTESESFWEVKQNTRCLVSWGARHVVVAFRGTASMKNALADLQAWRVAHPPVRGMRCMGTRPLVHVGFLKSWLAGGLNRKVTSTVLRAVQQCRKKLGPEEKITVFVTGHSLGGAMATLAAYDIRTGLRAEAGSTEVVCYTYAAPRTGNHAFARDYGAVVPDSWSVINDQDVVTREGKLLFLYKRPGQRVIVDAKGRLIVRPTHIEASVQRDTAGQSIQQHLLSSYFHAVLSVALAQFGTSGFPDGMLGIIRLAQASPYAQDLLASQMGMHLAEMQCYSEMDPTERFKAVLPGSHAPVKGFYLIKSSASEGRTKPAVQRCESGQLKTSPSLLSRLRSATTPILVPSFSWPASIPQSGHKKASDSTCCRPSSTDSAVNDTPDVIVDIAGEPLTH